MTPWTHRPWLVLTLLLVLGCARVPMRQRPPDDPNLNEHSVWIGYTPRPLLDDSHPTPRQEAERRPRLIELFDRAGCANTEVGKQRAPKVRAVTCRLPGEVDDTIVVSAGYGGSGPNHYRDAWASAAMLPSLYRSVSAVDRHHSYLFLAYDESRADAESLRSVPFPIEILSGEDRDRIVAVVGVRSIKFNYPGVWRVGADPHLYRDFVSVSKSIEIPAARIRVKNPTHGNDKIPKILVGIVDRWIGDYLDSFRLLAAYIAYLDHTIELRSKTSK